MCYLTYQLDPAFYITSPHLSFDAMLKRTGVELELISDPAMFEMIDDGIRGGVAMISMRYAKANNPGMGVLADSTKPESTIKGLDANNLYGWAMSQPLPVSKFSWVPVEELQRINWLEQRNDQEWGYIVKVDLQYPKELHDRDNDFPLAPERMYLRPELLSEKQVSIKAQYNLPRSDFNAKLILNLNPKKEYVVEFRILNFYLSHGMVLGQIHSGIKLQQSAWMAPYIALNQEKRVNARSGFQKDFHKLMNNSVFGKTCENQKKRTSILLVNEESKFRQLVAKPQFMDARIYSENLCVVESQKLRLWINKPFYLGFCILELAKLHMYRYEMVFFVTYFILYLDYFVTYRHISHISKPVLSSDLIASITTTSCNGSRWLS